MTKYLFVFFLLFLSTILVILNSCTSQMPPSKPDSSKPSPTITSTSTSSPSPTPTNSSPILPSPQSKEKDSSPYIYFADQNDIVFGSGVVFFERKYPSNGKTFYYVLTASHVIDRENFKSHRVGTSNKKYSFEIVKKSYAPDVAVIKFVSEEKLIPIKLKRCFNKSQTVLLHSFWSCQKGNDYIKIEGEIKNTQIINNDFQIIEYNNKTIAGMSGSALTDNKGLLLAIHFGSSQAQDKPPLDVCLLKNKTNAGKDENYPYINQGTSSKSISKFLETIDEIKDNIDRMFDESVCPDNVAIPTITTSKPCPPFYDPDDPKNKGCKD